MRKYFSLLPLLLLFQISYTQPPPTGVQKDSIRITEDLIINQQQKKLDSLIKERLEKQMEQVATGSREKEALQKQLEEIALADSLRTAVQKQRIQQLKATAQGYPVTLLKDTLFYMYLRMGSFNPAERAAAISDRIERLYDNDFFEPDSLHLVQNENTVDVMFQKDMIVLSVTELDALYYEKPQQELAEELMRAIREGIERNRQEHSLANWSKRLGYVGLVILGFLLVIFVINRLFRTLTRKLISQKEKYFRGIRFKSYDMFDERQHLVFTLRLIGVIKLVVILLALYLSLPILFSIFPQTKAYTHTLLNWIIDPARSVVKGIVGYLPNLFTILVVFFFTRYAIKGVKFLADEVQRGDLHLKGFYPDWAQPTFNIVRFLLYAFMLIIIFPYLPGSGSPAFQGVSVFLGILFSLGSSSAIANIVAGLVITYMRPFRVGDRVKIGDITGDVLEKTMLVTRVRTIKNEEITVPNATVLSSYTTNFTKGAENMGLVIHSTVTIGYDVPWQKIHEALITAANRTALVEAEPKPFVLQTELQDFYVAYQINAYTKYPASLARIYSDLHQNIQDSCRESGIEILSPHYRAMRDGNESTIGVEDETADTLKDKKLPNQNAEE